MNFLNEIKMNQRSAQLFHDHQMRVYISTDRMFAGLMIFQWIFGIIAAVWISPRTWTGIDSSIHIHVWTAIFLGGIITSLPVYMALRRSGETSTRYIIAIGQMLTSALLIHLTGGRIETHFHVFGSLAFLAFYRDIRVLIIATVVVALDHFLRGIYWPLSVYGVLAPSEWRWLEHAGWVIFEDFFLALSIFYSLHEMKLTAKNMEELETSKANVERTVEERTSQLKASTRRFETLCISSPVGIFESDSEGGCTYTNQQWQNISGLSMEESLGYNSRKMIHPDDKEIVLKEWSDCMVTKREFSYEFRITNPSRGLRWVHVRSKEVLNEHGVSSYVGTAEDITARRADADALRNLMNQVEAAGRAKGEFLATMSHEIRTPMNGVLGMTSLLLQTNLDKSQREYAETIHDSADSLLAILNDILDVSKIEAGKMRIEPVNFNLRKNVDQIAELFYAKLEEKKLELRILVSEETPSHFVGDVGRIRQILMNLVGNAIKFTKKGQITVKINSEAITENDALVRFRVQDDGIGITEDKLGSIFERFVQADASTTRKYGGTGLGLSISKQLVELMGGEIGVSSQFGRGSEFWFQLRLPIARVPADEDRYAPLTLGEQTFPIRILLAEDNTVNQKVAMGMLTKLGCTVDIASNGLEVLRMLEQFSYDLVLMDCLMPEMDGLEATRHIRSRESFGSTRIPIIAVTANSMEGDQRICFEAGMDDFLSKPVKLRDLHQKLQKWSPSKGDFDVLDPGPVLSEATILDRDQIQSILDLADPGLIQELIDAFLSQWEGSIDALRLAVKRNNSKELKDAAHKLKGSCLSLGLKNLSIVCQELEEQGNTNEFSRSNQLLSTLESEFQRSSAELSKELSVQLLK